MCDLTASEAVLLRLHEHAWPKQSRNRYESFENDGTKGIQGRCTDNDKILLGSQQSQTQDKSPISQDI